MLRVPKKKKIPVTLLRRIKNTELGKTMKNPTNTGKKRVKVTKKLKQKALAVYNLNYS